MNFEDLRAIINSEPTPHAACQAAFQALSVTLADRAGNESAVLELAGHLARHAGDLADAIFANPRASQDDTAG